MSSAPVRRNDNTRLCNSQEIPTLDRKSQGLPQSSFDEFLQTPSEYKNLVSPRSQSQPLCVDDSSGNKVHSDTKSDPSSDRLSSGGPSGFLCFIEEEDDEDDGDSSSTSEPSDPQEFAKENFIDHETFSEFLEARHTEEQLLFLHDIRKWRQEPTGELMRSMVGRYFHEESMQELNLGHVEKETVYSRVGGKEVGNVCLDVDLFDLTELHVMNTLRADALPAYFASNFFEAHLQEKHIFPDDCFHEFINAIDSVIRIATSNANEGSSWTRLSDKNGIGRWMSKPRLRFIGSISRMITSAAPDVLFKLLRTPETRVRLDRNMIQVDLVKRYSNNCSVFHCLAEMNVSGVKNRDLVHGRVVRKVSDKIWCIIDQSVDFEGCPPSPKGFVRMKNLGGYSGWLLRVLSDGKTEVSLIFHTFLGGAIPHSAMKKLAKRRMVATISSFVKAAEWMGKYGL